jgi:membrane-anchored protein YejM (alkaline phosphatase superfamily)
MAKRKSSKGYQPKPVLTFFSFLYSTSYIILTIVLFLLINPHLQSLYSDFRTEDFPISQLILASVVIVHLILIVFTLWKIRKVTLGEDLANNRNWIVIILLQMLFSFIGSAALIYTMLTPVFNFVQLVSSPGF